LKILNICDADPAGVGSALTEAVNEHTDHKARHIRMVPHRFGYPKDIETRNPDAVREWVEWADIVNVHCNFRPLRMNGTAQLRPKRMMITYHGRHYRRHHWRMHISAKKAGATWSLCTTPDLYQYGGAEWLPQPIPMDRYAEMRRGHERGKKPVICQTPSEPTREGQGTDKVKIYLGYQADWVLDIAFDVPHTEALQRKAKADIFIDRFDLGLGVSGLEALAMSIPTIADATPDAEAEIKRLVGYIPYYKASPKELPDAIDALLGDDALYNEYAERGQEYIRQLHDYPAVAEKYVEICRKVIANDV
jgi:hypothetical protein